MTNESESQSTDKARSDMWRGQRHDRLSREVAYVTRAISDYCGSASGDRSYGVTWKPIEMIGAPGATATEIKQIRLSSSLLDGATAPFTGALVDHLAGVAAHEAGHVKIAASDTYQSQVFDPLSGAVRNIVEDMAIDGAPGRTENAGLQAMIQIVRSDMRDEQIKSIGAHWRHIDASAPELSPIALVNLWGCGRLFDCMSVLDRRAGRELESDTIEQLDRIADDVQCTELPLQSEAIARAMSTATRDILAVLGVYTQEQEKRQSNRAKLEQERQEKRQRREQADRELADKRRDKQEQESDGESKPDKPRKSKPESGDDDEPENGKPDKPRKSKPESDGDPDDGSQSKSDDDGDPDDDASADDESGDTDGSDTDADGEPSDGDTDASGDDDATDGDGESDTPADGKSKSKSDKPADDGDPDDESDGDGSSDDGDGDPDADGEHADNGDGGHAGEPSTELDDSWASTPLPSPCPNSTEPERQLTRDDVDFWREVMQELATIEAARPAERGNRDAARTLKPYLDQRIVSQIARSFDQLASEPARRRRTDNGKIDKRRIVFAGVRDDVFGQMIDRQLDGTIILLLDLSLSTASQERLIKQAGASVYAALRPTPINCYVYTYGDPVVALLATPDRVVSFDTVRSDGNTPMGSAFRRAVADVKPRGQSVIINVTDGAPTDSDPWGSMQAARRAGYKVINVLVGSGARRPDQMEAASDAIVVLSSYAKLPAIIAQAVGEIVKSGKRALT